MQAVKDFWKGIWEENPIFRLILGMCPTLAVTNMAINGFVMGVATLFVLLVCDFAFILYSHLIKVSIARLGVLSSHT